ncbi:hypothetical protein P280DRAFT_57283 [Massarina eburnea CBS 473.64]|uniref:Cora-domain-containing protein n=1 Tax=Massarina eburnea CBS 473.64 TaxID=1395130 RepID=A0A6A6RZ94_9PLEO|nr:hypothetical protein P280DRAFT_57283 [Massarina eburnea CBS 473.64]
MREELGLIAEINMMQQEILSNYRRILEPCTFRATTLLRATRFKVEAHFIGIQLQNTHAVHLHLSDINSRLKDVSNHVSRMLKVQQENNGNTIIVFTIVTIIFLPLSWATSYLGMNTSDIRDLQQGQWLFWLIAVPVTTAVIGVAVLVVLKGESIREFFIRREAAKDGQRGGPSNMALKRRLSIRMTDDSMVRRRTTLEPDDNDSWRRFRKRSTRIRGEGEV